MGLNDMIRKLQRNSEKKKLLKEIDKCRRNNQDYKHLINTIIIRRYYLDDENFLNIIIDEFKKGNLDELKIEQFIRNLSVDIIINNNILFDLVVNYYSEWIVNTINNSDFIKLEYDDGFKTLIRNDEIKKKLINKLDIDSLGKKYYKMYLKSYSSANADDFIANLLNEFGFKFDDDYIYELLTSNNANVQNKLIKITRINENIVDRLYQYKFDLLKNWIKTKDGDMPHFYISTALIPSSNNKFANYWREQNIQLGYDALEFVFDKIKNFSAYDIFSEKSRQQIYDEFYKKEKDIRSANYILEHFNNDFDWIAGQLFDEDGLPLKNLFSRKDSLHLLSEILDYNHSGIAVKTNYNVELDYKTIGFLINNIDKIPDEYKFIIQKLKELEQIDDIEVRELAQKEFLLIMTDYDRMSYEKNRLYDKNGFNDKFFDSLLEANSLNYLDYYCQNWREKFSCNVLNWLENYRFILNKYVLKSIYSSEINDYVNSFLKQDIQLSYDEINKIFPDKRVEELIDYYFTNGKPNNKLCLALLFNYDNRRIILKNKELYEMLNEVQKKYFDFLKTINFDYRVSFNDTNLNNYFDEFGSKPELCIYLYENNYYDLLIDSELNYEKVLDEKANLILYNYKNIKDESLRNIYYDYIVKNKDIIDKDKINLVYELLLKISKSNSSELITLRSQIATQLLATDDPIGNFYLVEEKFVKNNLPTVGKIYSVFEILHPNFSGFNFSDSSMISPILKKKNNNIREFIVFSDLIRITIGSNNRSLKEYLNYIKLGDELYQLLKNDSNYEINDDEKNILNHYINYIITLYNNSKKGEISPYVRRTDDFLDCLDELKKLLSIDGNIDYSLSDRVISMFCHVAGFDTLEEVEKYMQHKISSADRNNRLKKFISLKQGDLIKGINNIKYLGHILQNGSIAKEYLGQYATSDATPLDTDLSMILNQGSTPEECMKGTEASSYGPIWFVLKNDNRLSFTRRSTSDPNQNIDDKTNLTKLETFYTGAIGSGHYGIRTGFSSSDIDYIIAEPYDKRIGLEIALNGFYIPVFDIKGNQVFSQEDYDKLREKMSGLSYYYTNEFKASDNLIIPGITDLAQKISDSISDVLKKRKCINEAIKRALSKFNLKLKNHYDGDLSEGFVELIDTGSTGRFTNMPGDGDFDFMMKLDRKIIENPEMLNDIKNALMEEFNCSSKDGIIGTGDFRLKGINLEGLDIPVDIDITFEVKTDKIAYSTDQCLKDRLENIKNSNLQEYHLIISNILLAKKFFKSFKVYKPNRGENPQGGLGGVGIENWILQNGGSFFDAVNSFMDTSRDKTFEEFKQNYVIWDFGENHFVTRKDIYPHDNFVYNMSEEGYNKMKEACRELILHPDIIKDLLNNSEKYQQHK